MAERTGRTREETRREVFLAARGLYAAAAGAWREGRLGFEDVVDAFNQLSRATARCLADAATDEEAQRFYRDEIAGVTELEARGLVELGIRSSGSHEHSAPSYMAHGLGSWLVARRDLDEVERRLAERLAEEGAERFRADVSTEAQREAVLDRHAFREAVLEAGWPRTWERATYDGLCDWTERARAVAAEFGYGPVLDREALSRRDVERSLGPHADDVLSALERGSRSDRLPSSAVALYVASARSGCDASAGEAASRMLDAHVAVVVERIESEANAVAETAGRRRQWHSASLDRTVRVAKRCLDRASNARPDLGSTEERDRRATRQGLILEHEARPLS